jgi:D-sedoheptulose 7-phosphate isomerase
MSDPLALLYPDLSAPEVASDETLLTSIRQKVQDSIEAKQRLLDTGAPALLALAKALADVFASGGRLLTMGNGGSSCDAAHVAVEFMHPITVGRRALPAMHLGADLPMLTAIGNDVGFASIFARQILAHGRPGDALLGISTSGNSDNLLEAFRVARREGLVTLGLSGHDGGRMTDEVDHCLVVPATSVHRIQEGHLVAYHILWDLVHTLLASKESP